MSRTSDLALLNQAWVNWNSDRMNQRFGQYVLSTYFPSVRCSSLFYEQNSRVAFQLLYEHLILDEIIEDWIE